MPITRRELIEAMDYSGGIDYRKMLPPEDERWEEEWHPASLSTLNSEIVERITSWARRLNPNKNIYKGDAVIKKKVMRILFYGL